MSTLLSLALILKSLAFCLFSTATLLKNPPADCQKIVDEYSDGKILMYEYKIQMGRCLKKAKEGGNIGLYQGAIIIDSMRSVFIILLTH